MELVCVRVELHELLDSPKLDKASELISIGPLTSECTRKLRVMLPKVGFEVELQ